MAAPVPAARLVAAAVAAVAASGLPTYQQVGIALVAQVPRPDRLVERLGLNHRLVPYPANGLPNCPQAEKEIETANLDPQCLDPQCLGLEYPGLQYLAVSPLLSPAHPLDWINPRLY